MEVRQSLMNYIFRYRNHNVSDCSDSMDVVSKKLILTYNNVYVVYYI